MADAHKSLREHLAYLLKGEGAHASFDDAVKDFPEKLRGKKLTEFPHTAWMLLEHLRLAQLDILEYSRDPKHVSPKWPEGYWPKHEAPPSADAWDKSVAAFKADLNAMQALVAAPKTDLFAPMPGTDGHTVLREALLLADHNAYHVGQLVMLRRMLGAWGE
jgi:hypothetical protein